MARSRYSRPPRQQPLGKKFIIVCEGRTEYNYFKAIRNSLDISPRQIDIPKPDPSDPRSIVNEAIRKRLIFRKDGAWNDGDTAWGVFDGDEHIEDNPRNWYEAIDKARANNIDLAISNPCIELWFLLHFQDQQAHINRSEAEHRLKKYLKEYKKPLVPYSNILELGTSEAIRRARWLAERIERDGLDRHANPCAGIYDLVERLSKLGQV